MKMKIIGIRDDGTESTLAVVEDWSLESIVISMETVDAEMRPRQRFAKIRWQRND